MHPLAVKLASELDLLYSLYQLADECAQKIRPDDSMDAKDSIGRWLDDRQRILTRSDLSAREVKSLMAQLNEDTHISMSEKAMVDEKKRLIDDIALKMRQTENQALRRIQIKLTEIRSELAGNSETRQAINAYVKSPRPLAMVA